MNRLPLRPANGHKGTFGTVCVIAGDLFMPGAPAAAALAALRAGCGGVHVAGHKNVVERILTLQPAAVGTHSLAVALAHAQCLVVGCGWTPIGHHATLRAIWRSEVPAILDGGALRAWARQWQHLGLRRGPTILTPHPGEAADLVRALGISHDPLISSQRRAAALALSEALDAVVVLKGPATVVALHKRSHLDRTGRVVLAIPGSGDVLAGTIASFVAQGLPLWDAACLGVEAHGHAGNLWARRNGQRGMLANELADLIPAACLKMSE